MASKPMMTAWLLPLLACVLLACSQVSTAAEDYSELEKWVIDNGGSLNVTIGRNKNGVRSLFTKVDGVAGDYVATIPSSVMINAGSLDSSIVAGTLVVLRELFDPHTRYKPYIKSWPGRNQVMNQCNFPRKYLHMLDSPYWERIINATQDYLELVLEGKNNNELEWTVKEMVGNAPVALDDLLYACAVSSTRYVTIEMRRRLMMIPIFDMENHKRSCPHTTSALDAGDSISITLGADVKAGDELCYSYMDTMRDDYAVVNYGFLQEEEHPPRLLKIDHPYFREDQEVELPEAFFTGTKDQLVAEVERLKGIQDRLKAADAQRPAGPRPGTDWVYDMLVQLQKRRRHAILVEIERLQEEIASSEEQHASEF